MRRLAQTTILLLIATASLGCGSDDDAQPDAARPMDGGAGYDAAAFDAAGSDAHVADASSAAFVVTSTAFVDGGTIPSNYTCDGDDISPQLTWAGAPAGTMSFAFVMKDVSFATPFLHSAAWDIPLARTSMPEDVPNSYQPYGATDLKQAVSWRSNVVGYAGPCPPSLHTYEFRVYALNVASLSSLTQGSSLQAVKTAIEAAAIGSTTIEGTYERN